MSVKRERNSLKTIWFFLKPYKKSLALLLFLAVVTGVLETVNIAVLYPILTLSLGVQSGLSSNPLLILMQDIVNILPISDAVVAYCVLFIILVVLAFISGVMLVFISVRIASKAVENNQNRIFDKYINSDYQFFIDNKQGELLYNSYRAPSYIGPLVNVLTRYSAEIILSITVFILLLSISWKGTVLVILGVLGYYGFTRYLSLKVSYIAGTAQYQASQRQNVLLNEYLTGVKQIKLFQTFPYWRTQFSDALRAFWEFWRKHTLWQQTPPLMLNLFLLSSVAIIVIVIKIQNPVGFTAIIPVFGTFAFAILKLAPRVAGFANYQMQIMNALPNLEVVSGVLRDERYTTIRDGNKNLERIDSNIEFKDVRFAYKGRDVVLDNVSLSIQRNKKTAIVGKSGSGKSTVLNLLLQLYDVNQGDIYIDSMSIKEYNIFSVLEKVGYVDQETFIYNASVKDNIAFGREYPMSEIMEAAGLANAHDFIQQLPEGYDTLVGDRGIKLSGGEKQRIAIARAMIRKPEILILDEATSSLDNVSEKVVQEAIDRVAQGCTTLIIAHRLSTIRNADMIYVLDSGKIVESGTHRQLMNQKGEYWGLYNIQER